MKIFRAFCLLLLAGITQAAEPARTLDLPAKAIFSKGPNQWNGDELDITVGRGANIGWSIAAQREEDVTVSIEYSCAQPLNQEFQLSFDGQDRFWEVPVTAEGAWSRVELGAFRVRAGLPVLVLLVPPSGRKYEHPFRFRKLIVESRTPGNLSLAGPVVEPAAPDATPGFGQRLAALHPALSALDLRIEGETMRISGMALRGPRELIFTTWEGDLFSLNLDAVSENGAPPFRRIARGLSEPMGLAVSGGRIFVTEKNEATELIDEDGDGKFETYRCLAHDWPATLDYHEYLFGAVVRDSRLYFSSSVAMGVRGKDNRQAPLRGSVIAVDVNTGKTEIVAGGLRTPDGLGLGPRGSILITDNQGEWLPGSKLLVVQPGAFYQFRSRAPWHPFDRPEATPPAVWLPQGEIAASPTEPILLPQSWGPYAGQVVFGDATFGGLQRAFLEEVDGVMQGAAFPFSQGLRHMLHRFVFTAEGELYAGGIARGLDREFIDRVSGLTRIRYTGREVFEPLAARLRSNGIELEFTLPLAEGRGWDPAGYFVTQWGYQATQTYGGAKVRPRRLDVRSATVSSDRRRVFLELPGLTAGEVLYVRLPQELPSASGQPLWAGELWYTVNRIPKDQPGIVKPAPAQPLAATAPYFRFSSDDAGRVLFQNFCSACHSLDATKLVGPSFYKLAGSKRTVRDATGKLHEVKADATYLRQSILEPNALLVDGYPENLMPPVGATLTEEQVESLVKYILKASQPK
jgi:cytochrome c